MGLSAAACALIEAAICAAEAVMYERLCAPERAEPAPAPLPLPVPLPVLPVLAASESQLSAWCSARMACCTLP